MVTLAMDVLGRAGVQLRQDPEALADGVAMRELVEGAVSALHQLGNDSQTAELMLRDHPFIDMLIKASYTIRYQFSVPVYFSIIGDRLLLFTVSARIFRLSTNRLRYTCCNFTSSEKKNRDLLLVLVCKKKIAASFVETLANWSELQREPLQIPFPANEALSFNFFFQL